MHELTDKRTARSKTWLLDDGRTRRCQIGGGIAHHRQNGVWVETDCTLDDGANEVRPGRHWLDIRIPRTFAAQVTVGGVTMRPLDISKPPARVTKGATDVLYQGAWEGIDVRRAVVPEGLEAQVRRLEGEIAELREHLRGLEEAYRASRLCARASYCRDYAPVSTNEEKSS